MISKQFAVKRVRAAFKFTYKTGAGHFISSEVELTAEGVDAVEGDTQLELGSGVIDSVRKLSATARRLAVAEVGNELNSMKG